MLTTRNQDTRKEATVKSKNQIMKKGTHDQALKHPILHLVQDDSE
jgi:hypothetical protein